MRQSADLLLMVRPSHFGFNEETAVTNSFQKPAHGNSLQSRAVAEFDGMVDRLRKEGIEVICMEDQPKANTPDSVFPNNWISMHHDGQVVLYPMATSNRRRERRNDILEHLQEKHDCSIEATWDISELEKSGQFLEGTGSIVFDHMKRIAYLSKSIRSSEQAFIELCRRLTYAPVVFDSKTYGSQSVYHTNVLLSVGTSFAVVCLQAIEDGDSKKRLIESLEKSNREIIDINEEQLFCFGANLLEVRNSNNQPFIACSETAVRSFHRDQTKRLERYATILPMSVPTIETHGGGSVRCMIAEVFLPRKKQSLEIKVVHMPADLESCFALRYEILRKPWNQPLGSERDEQEDFAWHLLACDSSGKAMGTARLQQLDDTSAQLRYMAVDTKMQGKGIGKMILQKAERLALQQGMQRVFLQARAHAVPFYQANGYHIIEKTFLLYGEIQHYSMEKRLTVQ